MFAKLLTMATLLAASTTQAVEVQPVTFRAAAPVSQQGQPHAGKELKGYLAKPPGAGPFGAVVALHGCGGMSERFKQEMTDRYTGWGYVTLVVDSFANHAVKFACGSSRAASRADERPGDAMGALQYLAALPDVDPRRIAFVGSSQGSWAALDAVQTRPAPVFANPGGHASRAVVAYYPDCRATFGSFEVPVLILIGGLDDWTPASRCEEMMQRRAGRGAPVELAVYPQARHGFDWVDLQPARRVSGYLMEYHEDAARQSMELHRAFLERHVGRAR